MSVPKESVSFRVVIPARLGSTRLPRKVLLDLGGKPVVQHVWETACASGAREIVIATDSEEVASVCRGFGADVALTSVSHASGSDRADEVARTRGWEAEGILVNLQGDEPRMPPALVQQVARLLAENAGAQLASLCHPLVDLAEWLDPNVVKVVMSAAGDALYFSRAPIPWLRDGSTRELPRLPEGYAYRHIGLYAYRIAALARFSALPPAPLERIEALEQLRALHHGLRLRMGVTTHIPPRGVDTEADLAALRAMWPGG